MTNEITCTVDRKLGILSEKDNGYSKQVNMVSWNGAKAKLDIREWSPNNEKCMKGITLTEQEGRKLLEALQELYGTDDELPM